MRGRDGERGIGRAGRSGGYACGAEAKCRLVWTLRVSVFGSGARQATLICRPSECDGATTQLRQSRRFSRTHNRPLFTETATILDNALRRSQTLDTRALIGVDASRREPRESSASVTTLRSAIGG